VIAQQTLGKNLKQTYLPSFIEKQCMCAIGCESAPGDTATRKTHQFHSFGKSVLQI
jgi:hypothetical protein